MMLRRVDADHGQDVIAGFGGRLLIREDHQWIQLTSSERVGSIRPALRDERNALCPLAVLAGVEYLDFAAAQGDFDGGELGAVGFSRIRARRRWPGRCCG